jgi:hypothetical protein
LFTVLDKTILTKLIAKEEIKQNAGQLGEQSVEQTFEQRGQLFVVIRRGEMRNGGGGC